MAFLSDYSNCFGDFSDEPEAFEVWKDFEFLFSDVLPALGVTFNAFDRYFECFEDRTQKFLVKLFGETQNQNAFDFGCEIIQKLESAEDAYSYQNSNKQERILGGHAYFIRQAIFDVLQHVCVEFVHEDFCCKEQNPHQEFHKRFAPFQERYLEHIADQNGFIQSELGAHYAGYADINEEYSEWQKEGLQRFADLYVQNYKLVEALKEREAFLKSKQWLVSIAQDFNREEEIIKCKYEFCALVENMLAQTFDVDIPKRHTGNLSGALAEFWGDQRKIRYDRQHIFSTSFNELLNTILHEFCHHLQRNLQVECGETKYIHRDEYERTVFFFHSSLYRNSKQNKFLYDQNIKERDANKFASKGIWILAKAQLSDDVNRALNGLMQPDAAKG
ncbi:MAG: hypothetical protein ACLFR0_02055 [Alphaproteobacteria bacterium]